LFYEQTEQEQIYIILHVLVTVGHSLSLASLAIALVLFLVLK